MRMFLLVVLVLAAAVLALQLWRLVDLRTADRAWQRLLPSAPAGPARFDPRLVAGLPEPARRYFLFAIRPGARLAPVALITMSGELGLGTKEAPGYVPMRAEQVLAPPHGLVWKVRAGSGLARVTGADGLAGGRSWVRFWLMGLVPVVRAGGDADHRRSAFGRVTAEAAIWAPAALLPQNGVAWEALDADTARAAVTHRGLTQTVDIRVDAEGRPLWVVIPRWSDANPDRTYRVQPFGGHLADFRAFDGYVLPTRVEGGNFFGTPDYFPFYKAKVESIRFPG